MAICLLLHCRWSWGSLVGSKQQAYVSRAAFWQLDSRLVFVSCLEFSAHRASQQLCFALIKLAPTFKLTHLSNSQASLLRKNYLQTTPTLGLWSWKAKRERQASLVMASGRIMSVYHSHESFLALSWTSLRQWTRLYYACSQLCCPKLASMLQLLTILKK